MKNKRPNIIIVCTDQQRTDTLSCYGSDFVSTPGFDRIADEGIKYERAYCTSAVCTPSRVSLLSGQYVSRHSVWNIGVNTCDDVEMIQHQLGKAGYQTGLIGKAHLEAYLAPPDMSQESIEGFEKGYGDWVGPYYGFDHVRLALGHVNSGMTGHYGSWLRETFTENEIEQFKVLAPLSDEKFGGEPYLSTLPLEYHNSVWTTKSALDFLDNVEGSEDPFFLFVSYQDPHHPHAIPMDCSPTVTPDRVPCPDFVEGELEDKPPHFNLAREGKLDGSRFPGPEFPISGQGVGYDFRKVSNSAAALGRANYYSMVGIIDAELQRLWAELESRNLFDDTLIIVTTDHGELLGDHGLWMKGPFHYDQIARIPLMIKPPKGMAVKPDNGKAVVSMVDLMPVCLNAAGLSRDSENIDGKDILTETVTDDRAVFVETIQNWHSLVCKTVVEGNWKLTWYAWESFGELYDLSSDPREKINLWEQPELQSKKSELIAKILTMKVETGKSSKNRISYA
ncbi:sulfatase-like hydrolase/transferase [Parasalinivibrio latis]|uniref:sulfatase family protein n=1 Tax=Parasalinivibrio latis TaxID=2952610 RepID=UPI0030E36E9E